MQSSALSVLLRPVLSRLRGLARRGTITGVSETRKMRELQVRAGVGDTRDRVEHFEPYGLTASPLDDAEAVILTLGADRAQTVALAVADRRARPRDLQRGDVAIYASSGPRIILRRNGGIEIESAQPVSIKAPSLVVDGDVSVTGNVTATGDVSVTGSVSATGDVSDGTRSMAADRTIFNQHTHAGVQSGSSTTAPPLPLQ